MRTDDATATDPADGLYASCQIAEFDPRNAGIRVGKKLGRIKLQACRSGERHLGRIYTTDLPPS